MVKLSTGAQFLTSKTVKTGEIVTIKDEGQWEASKFLKDDGSPSQQFNMTVDFKGEEKRVKFIKASRDAFFAKFGDETKDWIGKEGQITLIPSTNGKQSIWIQPADLL